MPRFSPAQPQRAKTRCSAGKAAASEEARRYVPHFVCGRSPLQQVLANGKASLVFPTSEKLNVEPLSDARTMLADFFSILLNTSCPPAHLRQCIFDMVTDVVIRFVR